MTALIFKDQPAWQAFEDKMANRAGLPKPGRSAATGELVEPSKPGGKGWTMRYSSPLLERGGVRILIRIGANPVLDAADAAKQETRAAELAKFGPVSKREV